MSDEFLVGFLAWFQRMRLGAANQGVNLEPLSEEERRRYLDVYVPAGEN